MFTDADLPDALDIAKAHYAAGNPVRDRETDRPLAWDELGDLLKLTLVTQAQSFIDLIAPHFAGHVERARQVAEGRVLFTAGATGSNREYVQQMLRELQTHAAKVAVMTGEHAAHRDPDGRRCALGLYLEGYTDAIGAMVTAYEGALADTAGAA